MEIADQRPSTISGASLSKLGQCEVCSVIEAKYTCPQCEVKTCSLKCSKIHKVELECSGQRDRTKFIPINKFTNLDLLSDYKLLEDISRSLESSKKKFGRKWNTSEYLMKLKNAARFQKIDLKFLPYTFERRRKNSTFLKFKDKCIHWHIEWVFVNADNTKIYDEKIPDNERICSILGKYFVLKQEDHLYEKLQFYQAAGLTGIKLFLKAEQKKGSKYYEVDANTSIKEALHNKLIIEYPTFHVVLRDHHNVYDVIDSDDEEETTGRIRSGNEVVDNIIKKVDKEDSAMKNLLFVSEYSENELSSD